MGPGKQGRGSELRIINQQISEADSTRSGGSEDEIESPPYNRTHFGSPASSTSCLPSFSLFPPSQKEARVPPADQLLTSRHDAPSLYGNVAESSPFQVTLENENLWKRFHDVGTEMVVTKLGRRMFPTVKVKLRNLNPTAYYFVIMDIVPFDKNRYKYTSEGWTVHSSGDFHLGPAVYVHPDSPAPGETWMKAPVSFHKVKLTNSFQNRNGHMMLNSMHKYMVRIHIVQGSDVVLLPFAYHHTFHLPLTAFIAVTAYQNEAIVNLKIQNNPFARGFRPMMRKEKRSLSDEEDLNNECSNESSSEQPNKKPSPPPTVTPLRNSNLLFPPVSSTQPSVGSSSIWPTPFSYLRTSQDLRGCGCSSCASSYIAHLRSENGIPPVYPFPSSYSLGNWQVPLIGLHSNSYLPHATSSSSSLNQLAYQNNYIPSPDVHRLPAFSGSSYQAQSEIFNRMIRDLPLRHNHWLATNSRPTTVENSFDIEH